MTIDSLKKIIPYVKRDNEFFDKHYDCHYLVENPIVYKNYVIGHSIYFFLQDREVKKVIFKYFLPKGSKINFNSYLSNNFTCIDYFKYDNLITYEGNTYNLTKHFTDQLEVIEIEVGLPK
ncbi:hypothetical protein ACLI09_17915 [Flavobacterium sp. RHBU_24]|uniref:hypothetical protein n=1 Tax=Flavobacterium sp. RHBU_24 TaxID=3391185 RepID=UPI003984C186